MPEDAPHHRVDMLNIKELRLAAVAIGIAGLVAYVLKHDLIPGLHAPQHQGGVNNLGASWRELSEEEIRDH